uniref:Protein DETOXIFICATION n=1 Tax=Chlamydomonas leiostraca TaxID=1034604 RepID=A0A7S0S1K1_9CHLO|mmetsp:Transcript_4067/g.10148  ORF Transcript_4067/g.10148 Transcript_4067/m.10148 type:complete len:639 (+) Transcript_4067:89-2005(+)
MLVQLRGYRRPPILGRLKQRTPVGTKVPIKLRARSVTSKAKNSDAANGATSTASAGSSRSPDGEEPAALSGQPSISIHLQGGKSESRTVWQDMQDILKLSLPLSLTNVSGFTLNCFSDAMIGRLGASALSTSTLANSFYGIMGISVIWGGAAGMETLAGQAYGARNYRVMRLVLLRAMVVCWGLCLPIVLLWQQAEGIMIALGQNPGIASKGALYLQALGPSLFCYVLAECLQSYVVCQNNVQPATWAKGITAALGPLFYYVLMFKMNLGLPGAAYAYALCKLTNALLLIGWLAWQQAQSTEEQKAESAAAAAAAAGNGATRNGASTPQSGSSSASQESGSEGSSSRGAGSSGAAGVPGAEVGLVAGAGAAAMAVPAVSEDKPERMVGLLEGISFFEIVDPKGCWEYIKYGLPSAAMTMLEWWAYEINVIMAGTLPNAEVAVAVLGICLAVSGWVYMFPQSIATATCTRVSNALGGGDAQSAERFFRAALTMVGVQQAVLASILLTFSSHIINFFCQDPSVMGIALGLLPIVACNTLADGMNVVLNGVLRACGRQALGARLQLFSYWCVGVPLAYMLGVRSGMGTQGFLLAIGMTSFTQAAVATFVVSRFSWQEEVERSQKLLHDMEATMEATSSSSK